MHADIAPLVRSGRALETLCISRRTLESNIFQDVLLKQYVFQDVLLGHYLSDPTLGQTGGRMRILLFYGPRRQDIFGQGPAPPTREKDGGGDFAPRLAPYS